MSHSFPPCQPGLTSLGSSEDSIHTSDRVTCPAAVDTQYTPLGFTKEGGLSHAVSSVSTQCSGHSAHSFTARAHLIPRTNMKRHCCPSSVDEEGLERLVTGLSLTALARGRAVLEARVGSVGRPALRACAPSAMASRLES